MEENTPIDVQLVGNKSDLSSDEVLTLRDINKTALCIKNKYPQINIITPYLITSAKKNLVIESNLESKLGPIKFGNYINI